jgi:hypothetical protein
VGDEIPAGLQAFADAANVLNIGIDDEDAEDAPALGHGGGSWHHVRWYPDVSIGRRSA